jgi:hypothetical protein
MLAVAQDKLVCRQQDEIRALGRVGTFHLVILQSKRQLMN